VQRIYWKGKRTCRFARRRSGACVCLTARVGAVAAAEAAGGRRVLTHGWAGCCWCVAVPRACPCPARRAARGAWRRFRGASVPHAQQMVHAPLFLSRALTGLPSVLLCHSTKLGLVCPRALPRQAMGWARLKLAPSGLRSSAGPVASELAMPLLLLSFNQLP